MIQSRHTVDDGNSYSRGNDGNGNDADVDVKIDFHLFHIQLSSDALWYRCRMACGM